MELNLGKSNLWVRRIKRLFEEEEPSNRKKKVKIEN